ncbi:MAG: 16S rRNA (guanine(527)-N(7))-methyltransferase RsmG [Candidatus Poribacteria bacterium]|nr:16S rRNA (guanine(527)-N(7))-methyltransferase RsmG [Candidatus Poribacteria bacterium]
MVNYKQHLKQTFNRYGFPLTARQVAQFTQYRAGLLRWNARINLTAITDDDEIVHKHFLDSLSVLEYITLRDGDSVIDVGTGAGFPGVVLKIYVPGIRLALVEASEKKASFLKFIVSQVRLHQPENVAILAERAEVCARQPAHIGAYDWVFTRYVATLADSADFCLPLLKQNGKWIAYKSGVETIKTEIDQSATRLNTLGGVVETVLTSAKFNRSYIVVRRVKEV